MDIIAEWKMERERRKRSILSSNPWENIILCLGSEGYSVKNIQDILTLGRDGDQGNRDMWDLGPGKAPKWSASQEEWAYNVIWNFFKQDIKKLYYGTTDSDGKIIKGQSTVNIQRIIQEKTGFKLPSQSMKNHMEEVWGFSMRKRLHKANSENPSTPGVIIEHTNATYLSDGQGFQDLQDHRVKRDCRPASSICPSPLSNFDDYQYTSNNMRVRYLEDQVKILTEGFNAALEIGHNQNMTLKSYEEEVQTLKDKIALLKSENSRLAMQNDEY